MIAEALDAGLDFVGALLACAVRVVRRVGAPVLGPVQASPPPPADEPPAPAPTGGPHENVEESKYWLGPERPQEPESVVDRESGELPRSYGRDRIILLPRDPWWTFTYWEVTPATRVRALRALGAEGERAREILRVYDITFLTFTGENAWLSFDVELPPGADHWYLNVGRPAASFCVEVGLRTAAGRFLPLARSNVVTTARSSPSPDTSVRWVELRPEAMRPTTVAWTGRRVPERDTNGGGPPLPEAESASSEVHATPSR